jgi:AraC-like DNA-binding protein
MPRRHRKVDPPRPLKSFEFSTKDLPRKERFEAWRESYASIFDFGHPTEAGGDFSGSHRVWDLGSLIFSRVRTDELDFAGLAGRSRRDPLDHWMLTLLLDGRSMTTVGSTQLVGNPGAVQMHQLGHAFEGTISRSQLLMLFVPRDLCSDAAHVLDAAAFSRLDGGMGRMFADYMISLAARLPLLDTSDLPELIAATRAMVLACVPPSSAQHLEEAGNTISCLLLERARRYIRANLCNPELDAEGILQDLGISRSRLYRLFETSGGVMRYVQRRRLKAAHEALTHPDDHRRILDIAENYCFGDAAEFSRAFRREFGYSPSDARAGIAHGAGGRTRAETASAPTQGLNVLLRRLQG